MLSLCPNPPSKVPTLHVGTNSTIWLSPGYHERFSLLLCQNTWRYSAVGSKSTESRGLVLPTTLTAHPLQISTVTTAFFSVTRTDHCYKCLECTFFHWFQSSTPLYLVATRVHIRCVDEDTTEGINTVAIASTTSEASTLSTSGGTRKKQPTKCAEIRSFSLSYIDERTPITPGHHDLFIDHRPCRASDEARTG